jgi:hypothetical protein
MEKLNYNKDVLTHLGSMNYILQVFDVDKNSDTVKVDQYQPRKNKIWSGEMDREDAKNQIRETIERMKIAINQFEEYLGDERNVVYYWENKEDINK